MHAAEFKRCVEELDVEGIRRLAAHVLPHLPAPNTDAEALTALHIARTQAEWLHLRHRAYSHRWLEERGLPSHLPDHLKPSAEQICPVVRSGVGISINFRDPLLRPAGELIRTAMSDVVENCFADGKQEPAYVTPRMSEAGRLERKRLFGMWEKVYAMAAKK